MIGMVEIVARAICQADEQNGGPPWDWYGSDKARSGYFDKARAAIEAMMTPTPEMVEAGRIQCDILDNGATRIWEAMLAAALEG